MKLTFDKKKVWYILLAVVLIASFLTNASMKVEEELVFGDEAFYATGGRGIAENLELKDVPFNGTDIREEPPMTREPITMVTLASFYMIAGVFGMKLLVPIVSVMSALFLFLLVKKFHSTRTGVIAATVYLAVPAIVTHTVFIYVEHIAVMYLIGSFYFLYSYLQDERRLHLIMTAVLFVLSVYTAQNVLIVPIIYAIVLFIYKVSWKGWAKEFGTIVLIALVMMAPWMAHNYRIGNDLGFDTGRVLGPLGIDFGEETDYEERLPEIETEGFAERMVEREAIHERGYLGFIEFAYTIPIFVLAVLGFSFYLVEKNKKYSLPIIWALFMFGFIYALLWDRNIDMVSRNTLFIIPPLAMAAGYASDKIYEYLDGFESAGKMLAVIFLLSLVGWSLFTASAKAESMRPLKRFSEPFFEGCGWIRENTEEDAIVYYVYDDRVDYHCWRPNVNNMYHGMEDAIVASDERTYETFRAIGIDYLMIHSRLLDREARRETQSFDFVQYVMFDPNYEQVYSYPDGCNVFDMQQDCMAVYRVLDEDEVEEPGMEEGITIDPEDLEGEGEEEAQIELG